MIRTGLSRTLLLPCAASLLALAGCGPDLATCNDQLELRFDEPLARDYVLVLEVDGEVVSVDCSIDTHPASEGDTIEVDLGGTVEGRATCGTRSVLLGLTPERGDLALTYRLADSSDFDLLETSFTVTYEEVEAESGTCRQAVLIVDVGCLQGTSCQDGGEGGGGDDLPT